MSELEIDEWSARVTRLERRERRMTGVVVLLLLLVLLQMVWHIVPGSGPVSASAFMLQKGNEPPRAQIYLWQDGTPCFRLNTERGEARGLWALRPDGTLSLRQMDPHFNTRTEMVVDADGNPAIVISDERGRPAARLGLDERGHGVLNGVDRSTP